MTGILLVSSTDSIAFLLVVPLLVIVHRGTIVVTFIPFLSIILIIWLSIIMVPQSEPFNRCGEGLHLPLLYVGRVFGILVGGVLECVSMLLSG